MAKLTTFVAVIMTREQEFSNKLNHTANFKGCTALHYATLLSDVQMVKTLVEAGNVRYQCSIKGYLVWFLMSRTAL